MNRPTWIGVAVLVLILGAGAWAVARQAGSAGPAPRTSGDSAAPSVDGPRTPVSGPFPDAGTTGVTDPAALKPSGCVEASSPGQVVENLLITDCDIDITAPGVVVRNVRLVSSANDRWGVIVREGGSAVIEHVEISGHDKAQRSLQYAVLSQTTSTVVVRRSELQRCADCLQGENMRIVGNYIHDLANIRGLSHVDGIQCNASCGLTVRGNTILNEYPQTSAIALFGDFGTPKDSEITGNLLAGGGWTVYGGVPASRNITISGNTISRRYFPQGGRFGWLSRGGDNTVSGNRYEDGTPADAP